MKARRSAARRLSLGIVALGLVVGTVTPAASAGPDFEAGLDPEAVVTAESCGECHASEMVVWQKTPHATGFKTMHRESSAGAIAERMGIKLIKRDSVCLDCHFTSQVKREQLRAVSGVSCESCHGAGRDWIDLHNDYGAKDATFETESADHRRQRIEASRAAGMRRPSDLYPVVSSCFGCHTVPNEELVNVGKHSIGSSGFELVQWTEKIRHNFLQSFLTGDGTENAAPTDAHKRRMYVVGRALDLEHSLRGLAQATESGVFFKAMQRRLRSAVSEVRLIARATDLDVARQMVEVTRQVDAQLGKQSELTDAARRIGELNRSFIESFDPTPGSASSRALAALDPAIAGGTLDLPDEPQEPVVAEGSQTGGTVAAPGSGEPTAGTGAAGSSPSTGRREETIPGVEAEGEKRSHLRPRSDFETLAASACQKCHGDQNAWWFDDPHFASVEPFLDGDPKASQIARLYGISPNQMARGDSLCMDCHGTVATARRGREAQDGVSCQSCHGPGAAYLDPHQEGELSQGRARPGYQAALKLGMVDLQELEVRLQNCASCHYVTDPRLISAGHPTGTDFDVAEGMAQVRHWQDPLDDAGSLQAAYTAIQRTRGSIPQVRRARLPQTRVIDADGQVVEAPPADARPRRVRAAVPLRRAPRPVDRRSLDEGDSTLDLQELPAAPENGAVEEVLRFVQDRIEWLYKALGNQRVHGGRQEGDGP